MYHVNNKLLYCFQASMMKEGVMTWEQLAQSRLKHNVAAMYDLGPKARKKPRKEKIVEGIVVMF